MQMRRTGAVSPSRPWRPVLPRVAVEAATPPSWTSSRVAKEITIGTKWDQPEPGPEKAGGDPRGLRRRCRQVHREGAGRRPGCEDHVEGVALGQPRGAAPNGTVDIIFATYSITDARKPKVTFGGPYVVVHQDTMVRADAADITKATDLKDKRICQAQGSNSYKRITERPPDGKLDLSRQARRSQRLRRVRAQAQWWQPGRGHHRQPDPRRLRQPGPGQVQAAQRPLHRREVRHRPEEGRQDDLRGRQQGRRPRCGRTARPTSCSRSGSARPAWSCPRSPAGRGLRLIHTSAAAGDPAAAAVITGGARWTELFDAFPTCRRAF